ncbi:hypothetical protein BT93_E2903 [Corymbia citriodora subsp. variegata]|nr:hypothetical protein BT93_E2903 [Corymbia citriodora subsp. variegata]KAF8030607.1 hypothetical protein BT93_E2903 [Corymbia citriodora subsp. variegata]
MLKLDGFLSKIVIISGREERRVKQGGIYVDHGFQAFHVILGLGSKWQNSFPYWRPTV